MLSLPAFVVAGSDVPMQSAKRKMRDRRWEEGSV